jgi:hypothetical protein
MACLSFAAKKIHSMLHSASEIMRWGNLINCSGEAAEGGHKINVKGPGKNINHRDSSGATLMSHARRKEAAHLLGSAIQGIWKYSILSVKYYVVFGSICFIFEC